MSIDRLDFYNPPYTRGIYNANTANCSNGENMDISGNRPLYLIVFITGTPGSAGW